MRKAIVAGAVLAGLAGCVETQQVAEDGGAMVPRNTSAAALAALPVGIPPAFLIRDGNGCYGIALEVSDPPQGIPLRDAFGQQVCDA